MSRPGRNSLWEVHAFLGAPRPATQPESALSNRELDVLELVAAALSNEEIPARLFISVRTVERHLSRIYVKFGASGRAARAAAAATFARRGQPPGRRRT
jgi:DNA-binding NarL/FixJ family response regulator